MGTKIKTVWPFLRKHLLILFFFKTMVELVYRCHRQNFFLRKKQQIFDINSKTAFESEHVSKALSSFVVLDLKFVGFLRKSENVCTKKDSFSDKHGSIKIHIPIHP